MINRESKSWNGTRSSRTFIFIISLLATILLTPATFAADPGTALGVDGNASDQKPGSILFFNVYTSDATSATSQNTKFSITNTSPTKPVAIHLFFVDGVTGSPADFLFCLTASQTISFESVELDPNTEGFIVVVAVDSDGAPIIHNHLIGEAMVKFSTGHEASLSAIGVAASSVPTITPSTVAVDLNFNGTQYEQLPAVLAVDNLPSRINNNDTMMILNRPGGDLATGAPELGSVFGLLYNDTENAYSFSINSTRSQYRLNFTSTTPRTVPRFTSVVPDGRTGWVKVYSNSTIPILGAVLTHNSGSNSGHNAFTGGHNLHQIRRASMTMSIPVFPTTCFNR